MENKCCYNVKIPVCVLIILFGTGSWITINGIWVEIPILVDHLPEGWNLPSYIAVVIQIANIGPIAYTIWSLVRSKTSAESYTACIMILTGSAAALLMAFFWRRTSMVGGTEHSTALVILVFFQALVACSSSVVFLPFMSRFKPEYIIYYYIGEGFGALSPSLVSLVQGVGSVTCEERFSNTSTNSTLYSMEAVYLPPKFAVRDFFLFIFAMMVTCGVAYVSLLKLPYCKTEHAENDSKLEHFEGNDLEKSPSEKPIALKSNGNKSTDNGAMNENYPRTMSQFRRIYFYIIMGLINCLRNGALPSVQSYACLPYGTETYHLAVTLSNIATPVACFIAFFVPVRSGRYLGVTTFLGLLWSAYIVVLAAGSPTPVLVDSSAGGFLVVVAYVIVYLTFTFTKVSIATLFRLEGRNALLWCGAVIQFGSAVGAAVIFVVVNVYGIFQQKLPCS